MAWFILGAFVGCIIGIVMMCLCKVQKHEEELLEAEWRKMNERTEKKCN